MRILTVRELSEILKVKPKTLYQWAELGVIPCLKLNRCLRFDFDEILKWLQNCKKQPQLGYNPFTQARGPRKGGKN
jgi:excisionase family DNA binding protein